MNKAAKRILAAAAGVSLVMTPLGAMAQEEMTESAPEGILETVESETEGIVSDNLYDPEGITATVTFGGNALGDEVDDVFSQSQFVVRAGEAGSALIENIIYDLPYGSFSFNWAVDAETGMLSFDVPETGENTQYQIDLQQLLGSFISALDEQNDGAGTESHIDPEKALTTLMPYAEKLSAFMYEYTQLQEGEFELPLLGETADGSGAVLTLTGTGLANLMNDLALQIENDPDLKELLGDIADEMERTNANANAITGQLSEQLGDEELAEEVFSGSVDQESIEAVRSLADVLPELLRQGADSLSEIGNFGICTLTVGLDTEGHIALINVSVLGGSSIEAEDGSYIGLHYENHDGRLAAVLGAGEQTIDLRASYDHSYGTAAGQYELSMDGMTLLSGDYSFYPGENEELSILETPYGSFSFDSELLGLDTDLFITAAEDGSDDYQFFFTYAEPGDEEADSVSFWINLNAAMGAELTLPAGQVQDVTGYNAEQYGELLESILEKLEENLDFPEEMTE